MLQFKIYKRPNFLIYLLVLLLTIPIQIGYAQENVLTKGRVVDNNNEPIPGVNILIKGTQQGTISDFDGNFSIDAANGATLVFSFIGFQKKELVVDHNNQQISVVLKSQLDLDEVVVIGYGSQKKENITGAVANLTSEKMEERATANLGNLVQGQMSGVQVVTNSGKPSEGLKMRIRGTNSVTAGSEPLYVVDGVPTTDTRAINPSDIESISVL